MGRRLCNFVYRGTTARQRVSYANFSRSKWLVSTTTIPGYTDTVVITTVQQHYCRLLHTTETSTEKAVTLNWLRNLALSRTVSSLLLLYISLLIALFRRRRKDEPHRLRSMSRVPEGLCGRLPPPGVGCRQPRPSRDHAGETRQRLPSLVCALRSTRRGGGGAAGLLICSTE